MQVRLRPGMRVLWRDPDTVQVGPGATARVTLTNPNARQLALLADLQAQGVAHDRANPVLSRLYDANLLLPMSRANMQGLNHACRTRLAGDAQILGIADELGEGWRALAGRQRSTVEIQGLGRTGALLARALAHAGVGRLIISDDGPIAREDTAPGGYSPRHVSESREGILRAILERDHPEVSVATASAAAPDLTILIERYVANPIRYQGLMRQDIPHLSILMSDDHATVGPVVIPGKSPCLQCLDLHRLDHDPAWPMLATQLMNIQLSEPQPEESLLAGLTAYLAAGQVLSVLAAGTPKAVGSTMEFRVGSYMPALRKWTMHPDCGCSHLE